MRASILILLAVFSLTGCPARKPEVQAGAGAATGEPKVQAAAGKPAVNSLQVVTTRFKVEGMDCPDCSKAIENKLIGLPGVTTVSADEKAGQAVVQYDAGKITKADIIAALGSLKFTATVKE